MPIIQMVSEERYLESPETVRIVRDYRGHEEGIHHEPNCPHYGKFYGGIELGSDKTLSADCPNTISNCCRKVRPLYLETTHKGLVLALGENNYYDDSDFYAEVWNPEKKGVDKVYYASTRGWTYPNGASVDATPEVCEAYEAMVRANREATQERLRIQREERMAREEERNRKLEALRKRIGSDVELKRAKKNIVGRLFWVGVNAKGAIRIGAMTAEGKTVWDNASRIVD